MGDVVNLRKARKAQARRADDARAAENRLLHGRSKIERTIGAARMVKSHRDLDAHRVDTGDKP
jgi:hypothetical protein